MHDRGTKELDAARYEATPGRSTACSQVGDADVGGGVGASLECSSTEEPVPDGGETARRRRLLDVESVTLAETMLSALPELSDNDDDGVSDRECCRTVL